ncbi:MAG: hypothetical protein ACRCX2_15205 [Paraclostridium sp.]
MKILFTIENELTRVMEGETSKLVPVIMFEELAGDIVFVQNHGTYVTCETNKCENVKISTESPEDAKEIFESIKTKMEMLFSVFVKENENQEFTYETNISDLMPSEPLVFDRA